MMMLSPAKALSLISLCFWAGQTGTEALKWHNSTHGGPLIQICSGDNFTFPWTFQLNPGEQLEDIKWLYTAPGGQPGSSGTPDLMANYIYGHFIAMPPFSDRLVYLGNGNLVVKHMTRADDGTYTVEVVTTHSRRGAQTGSGYASVQKEAQVEVAEPPSNVATSLNVGVAKGAVYDNVTREWHVLLTCGQFSSNGNQSSPDVTWTTPDGSQLKSSYSDKGVFFLRVPNPVQEGDYTCHVPYIPAALHCLPGNTSVPQDASFHVDGTTARFMLLEAKQQALLEQNQRLASQLTHAMGQLADLQRKLADVEDCCNAKNNAANSTGGSRKTESVLAEFMETENAGFNRTRNELASVREDLTSVRREMAELGSCCIPRDVNHKRPRNPDSPVKNGGHKRSFGDGVTRDQTNGPHEMTSAGPPSTVTRGSSVSEAQHGTSTKEDLDYIWQNLTTHVTAMQTTLQRYQAQCSRRVAFHAQASQQQYNDNDHILFNEEVFLNDGNAFNTSSGEFIVPVNGIYVLLASTSAYGIYGASCDADLTVDSRAVARMLGAHMNSYNQVTGHAVMHLHRGQRVWVRSIGATNIDTRSIFSGFLLKPDW